MDDSPVPKRVHVVSLGCAKALVDTEVFLAQLERRGYEPTADDEAELYLINTCGFLDEALDETFAEIERLVGLKKSYPGSRLAVVGCAAEALKNEIAERFPEADLVAGTGALARLGELVERLEKRRPEEGVLFDFPPPGGAYDGNPDPLPERVALTLPHVAYLKLAEGCDLGCTFCAIPALRGPQRSRPVEHLVAEALTLVEEGVRELILIAQETTAYGRDIYGEPSLVRLLADLCLQLPEEDVWVRLLYPNPARVDEALLDCFAACHQLVSYLDLPFQHADEGVLRDMGRPGDVAALADLVALARRRVPGLVLRGTALVGFPTEDQAAFDRLVRFVEETGFDHLGVFTYSARPGTRAADEFGDPIPIEVKELRAEALHDLQEAVSFTRNDRLVGNEDEVLVDAVSAKAAVARGRRFCPEADGVVEVSLPEGHGWLPGDFRRVVYAAAQ
ncbi:MAG TPA: 30S ribosomal protein S12 methylthiotransferase RimO, partial [Candidatus Coatesbacteria bacterium]|nr:30S ribosomal protein S12 methylthiotransferase RimO [Candidatus Coatesbacteria bacterium]